MRHLDLFSGIGGFALAAEWAFGEVEHVFCDNEPFAQAVLAKHWPNAKIYKDIVELNKGLKDGTIVLWNEDATENAQTAKNDPKQPGDPTANPATQRESTHGMSQTERNVGQGIGGGREKKRTKLSNTTEENVHVVGKEKSCFSPSTTSTEGETSSDVPTNLKHGNSPSKENSQPTTKSSATTVITQKPTTKYVHTTKVDLLTGGFPCQPFSQAGRRKGTEDSRHLWPAMLETIRLTTPRWVIGENVGGLVTWSDGLVLEQVCADLEEAGYEVQAFIIPACAVNAPHRRDRVWIVANSRTARLQGSEQQSARGKGTGTRKESTHGPTSECNNDASDATSGQHVPERKEKTNTGHISQRDKWEQNWPEVAARLCRVDDGLPRRMDRTPRLKALGNAIVPQVAYQIMLAIKEVDLAPSPEKEAEGLLAKEEKA